MYSRARKPHYAVRLVSKRLPIERVETMTVLRVTGADLVLSAHSVTPDIDLAFPLQAILGVLAWVVSSSSTLKTFRKTQAHGIMGMRGYIYI